MSSQDTIQRFSLRKSAIGLASILLGSFFLVGPSVLADETVQSEPVTETVLAERGDEALAAGTVAEAVADLKVDEGEDLEPEMTESEVGDTEEVTKEVPSKPLFENPETTTEHLSLADTELEKDKEWLLATDEPIQIDPTKPFRSVANPNDVIGDNYPSYYKNGRIWTDSDKWNMYVKECVSFAAFRLSTVNGFELVGYGNANAWGHMARSQGYRVDMTPAKGAVAWFDSNQYYASEYGHVAWVSDVAGDMVELEEYNYGSPDHVYHRRVIHKSQVSGYIHFKDLTGNTSTKPVASTPGKLPSSGIYYFTGYASVRAEPKVSSPELAHYDKGYSVNYDRVLQADGHEWLSYVAGSGNRRYVAIREVAKPVQKVTGTITVANKNTKRGTFDVIISNVSSPEGVRAVKVPIWSAQNDQDDIIWYTATKQSDSSYKVSVNINQHQNDRGQYHIHLYYVQNDRQMVGVTTATTSMESPTPVTPTVSLPSSGRYTFKQRSSVRNAPSLTSPELAFYNAGDSVNYDRVLTAEGRQWLSYISYSGNRRYIAIN